MPGMFVSNPPEHRVVVVFSVTSAGDVASCPVKHVASNEPTSTSPFVITAAAIRCCLP
jgi:uncharacterized protein (UPF0305 family)